MKRLSMAVLLAAFVAPSVAHANDEAMCSLDSEVDKYQLLRRLTLDLTHELPSYEAYRALDSEDSVPDATIDAMLASEQFAAAVTRYHEKLLWPNLGRVLLFPTSRILRRGPNDIHYLSGQRKSVVYRGGNTIRMCQDKPQTAIEPSYQPGDKPACETVEENGASFCVEGWVEMHPYWLADPNETIKVCAFDAQLAETGFSSPGPANPTPGPVSCNTIESEGSGDCGCGPTLRNCVGEGVGEAVARDMREQLMRTISEHAISGNYADMLFVNEVYDNGRLAFWRKYLAHINSVERTYNAWHEGDIELPSEPDYLDTTWVKREQASPHSGILTLPGFTLRYQTNRGRANRFRLAFQNQAFVPSSEPDTGDCDDTTDNLTERCSCRYCHSTLEPLAAHFAVIAESGSTTMLDFPTYREDCIGTAAAPSPGSAFDPWCARFYVTDADHPQAGYLIANQYAEDSMDGYSAAIAAGVAAGPAGLAQAALDDGSFAKGTVEQVFAHFVGRAMDVDASSASSERDLRDALASELIDSGYDFVSLVRSVVELPAYRRIR